METDIKILIEKFIAQKQYAEDRSKTTMLNYHWVFKKMLQLMPEIMTTRDLSRDNVVEFLKRLDERMRVVGINKVHGISSSTKRTYISKLNTFCEWLCDNGCIVNNPITNKKLKRPKIVDGDKKYLNIYELERILLAIAHNIIWENNFIKTRNELIIVLSFTCCLRRSELLGLLISDLDLDNSMLTVRGNTSKSKKTRHVPINSWCMDKLKIYLVERSKKHYKNPYLFVANRVDRSFTTHGLKHITCKIEKASGINFHMHQLRHTGAYVMKKNNVNTSSIQNVLGHSDLKNTQVYLSGFPETENRKYIEGITLQNLR